MLASEMLNQITDIVKPELAKLPEIERHGKVLIGTVEAIKAAGLGDGVKIMIGGGQVSDKVRGCASADAYGDDAMEAVNLPRKWIGGN